MSRFHLLLAALLVFAPGCAKMASESAAMAPPAEPAPAYAAGGGADYGAPTGDSDDYATRDSGRVYLTDEAERSEEAPQAAPTTTNAAPAAGMPKRETKAAPIEEPAQKKPASASEGKDSDTDPPKQFARQIIYTAELAMSVFKLDEAMQRAESLTLEVGGYVQQMSTGYLVLRIPAAQLRRVMDELARLGVVESRVLQAQDVTQEFFDLQTRIRVLKETQTQLIALLKQARNVEEALKVRQSLDAITMELEQAIGRMRLLENLIGFSTLTLRMSERGPANTIPSSNDPFPWVDTLGVEATEWN